MNNSVVTSAVFLAASIASLPVLAEPQAAETVVVTATRFPSTTAAAPVNITVISQEDIARSGATNLADVLASQSGIQVQSLFGVTAADTRLDMGGFGATGGQNTLVLLNGRRLNDFDLSGTNLAAIPLDSIARIEILHGTGTVLYGDSAVGGVINIVTKNGFDKSPSAVGVSAGSYGTGAISARLSRSSDTTAFLASAESQKTDGYRDQDSSDNRQGFAEITRSDGTNTYGLRALVHSEDRQFPGALNEPVYLSDPRSAGTSVGTGKEQQRTVEGFMSTPNLAAELAVYHKDQSAVLFGDTRSALDTFSFTPRYTTRFSHQTLITGIDYYRSTLDAQGDFAPPFPASNESNITRDSYALYANDTIELGSALSLNLGARREGVSVDVDSADLLGGTTTHEERRDWLNAWDAALSYQHENGARSYLRFADSFRFPVLDEIWSYFDGSVTLLKPQRGRHIELGTHIPLSKTGTLDASVFRVNVTDEIGFDLATYTNINLDPTRHEGLDLQWRDNVTDNWTVRLGYTYRKATFRDGPNAGNYVPEVPRQNLVLANTLRIQDRQYLSLEGVYTGQRYFGDDFTNAGKQMPSHTLWNLGYTYKPGPWKLHAAVTNLFNKKTADAGYYSPYTANPYYYYPLPERAVLVSLEAYF